MDFEHKITFDDIRARLDRITALVEELKIREGRHMAELDDRIKSLQASQATMETNLANLTTQVTTAVTYIQGVPGLIATAVTDALAKGATADQLAALSALQDQITTDGSTIAQDTATLAAATAPPSSGSTSLGTTAPGT